MEHPVLLKQMIQAAYGVGAGVSTDQPVRSFEASDALGAPFRYLDYWAGGLVEEGRTWDSTKNASKKSPVIVPWCRLKRNGVRRESMGKTPYPRETRPNGPYGSDEDLLRLAGMTMEQAEREAILAEDESVPDPLTGRIRYRGEPAPEGGPEPSTENR